MNTLGKNAGQPADSALARSVAEALAREGLAYNQRKAASATAVRKNLDGILPTQAAAPLDKKPAPRAAHVAQSPAPKAARTSIFIQIARVLTPFAVAAPLAINLLLLEVMPWYLALALLLFFGLMAAAIYDLARDLFVAPSWRPRHMRASALHVYVFTLSTALAALWVHSKALPLGWFTLALVPSMLWILAVEAREGWKSNIAFMARAAMDPEATLEWPSPVRGNDDGLLKAMRGMGEFHAESFVYGDI